MDQSPKKPSSRRRRQSRILLVLAMLATLVAIFYLEEDWRGKQAWQKSRQELIAKGAILDWEKIMPAPVADDENIFMASTNIRIRFVKAQTDAQIKIATNLTWLVASFSGLPEQRFSRTNPLVIADLKIASAPATGAPLIRLDDPMAGQQLAGIIRTNLGRCVVGCAGFPFSEHDLVHSTPAQITIETTSAPSTNELQRIVPADLATNIGQLTVLPTSDPATFHLAFTSGRITAAAEYLRWTDQFSSDFDDVRAALKRPYALIPGDFSEPYTIPIPNFVTMRWFAQTLAQRVQCHILTGEPEKALPDLTLMHDVCRILEHRPSRTPMTLVEAMINVAITGLYTTTVQDGLRAHAWKESDLAALQAQFKEVDLGPDIYSAFQCEQTHIVRLGERSNFEKLLTGELFGYGQGKPWYGKIWQHTLYTLFPQGWIDQNIKIAAEADQAMIDSFQPTSARVYPDQIEQAMHQLETSVQQRSLFHLLASIAVPNFRKALQTYSFNQTGANEGQIACALERYRLASGNYPETLDALVPRFMDKIPTDLFGGQPLRYKRTDNDSFILYSLGWNETDDAGSPGVLAEPKKGDWAWKN